MTGNWKHIQREILWWLCYYLWAIFQVSMPELCKHGHCQGVRVLQGNCRSGCGEEGGRGRLHNSSSWLSVWLSGPMGTADSLLWVPAATWRDATTGKWVREFWGIYKQKVCSSHSMIDWSCNGQFWLQIPWEKMCCYNHHLFSKTHNNLIVPTNMIVHILL